MAQKEVDRFLGEMIVKGVPDSPVKSLWPKTFKGILMFKVIKHIHPNMSTLSLTEPLVSYRP